MSPNDKRHGSEAGHEQHRRDGEDPCPACYEEKLKAARRRTKRKTMGHRFTVPSDAARERLDEWRRGGATWGEIADHTGVEESRLWEIANNGAPVIYPRTEAAILRTPGWPVTVVGLQRRVRALSRLGWTVPPIAEACAVSHDTILDLRRRRPEFVARKVRAGILSGYETLSMKLPDGATRQVRAGITRARNQATREDWAPPLAWLDIDDPTERPTIGAPEVRAANGGRNVANLLEDAEWLADGDAALSEVIERLDVRLDTFRDTCARAGRSDLYWRLARREPDGDMRWANRRVPKSQGEVA